jgi:hypothetical protein
VVRDHERYRRRDLHSRTDTTSPDVHVQGDQLSVEKEVTRPPTGRLAWPLSWVTPTVGAVTRSHVVPKIRWSVLIEAGQQLVAMLF